MEQNLLQVALVEKTSSLNEELAKYVIIGEDQKCFVCKKHVRSITGETLLMYNTENAMVTTHYNCGKVMEEMLQQVNRKSIKTLGELL